MNDGFSNCSQAFKKSKCVTSLDKTSIMSEFDVLEDGAPCDFCGNPISFNDDDWAVCETCRAEYTNMDYADGYIE